MARTEDERGAAEMIVCILAGGPLLNISVGGRIIEFEMHPYSGPHILDRNGNPLKHQPADFLKAASLWAQQGQRMEDGLCRWDHEREPIAEHLGGRHWKVTGYEDARRGW